MLKQILEHESLVVPTWLPGNHLRLQEVTVLSQETWHTHPLWIHRWLFYVLIKQVTTVMRYGPAPSIPRHWPPGSSLMWQGNPYFLTTLASKPQDYQTDVIQPLNASKNKRNICSQHESLRQLFEWQMFLLDRWVSLSTTLGDFR